MRVLYVWEGKTKPAVARLGWPGADDSRFDFVLLAAAGQGGGATARRLRDGSESLRALARMMTTMVRAH